MSARLPHIAGICYLFVIGCGIFVAIFVRERLFVAGDPAATALAVSANEGLWRLGIAVHLIYLLAAATFTVVLYRIFRRVGPTLALLALVLSISDIAVEALLLNLLYVPLLALDGDGPAAVFNEPQRHAAAHLSIRMFHIGWSFALTLFAGFCTFTGILILRSTMIARFIGVLMIGAGLSYFLNGVSGIIAPTVRNALLPWTLLLPFAGELSLALWLTIKGVRQSPDQEIA